MSQALEDLKELKNIPDFPVHDLCPTRASLHMAVFAGKIAESAYIDLHNFHLICCVPIFFPCDPIVKVRDVF